MPGHVLRGTRNLRTVAPLVSTHGPDAVVGSSSVCGFLHSHGVPVFPADAQQAEHPEFNGGWTVHQYGTLRAPLGGVVVDALQLEVGRQFRRDVEARKNFARTLAQGTCYVVFAFSCSHKRADKITGATAFASTYMLPTQPREGK